MRGDGRVFKRGNIFWCAYSLRGKEYRESCETADELTAKKYLQSKMREVGADVIGAKTFTTPRAAKITIRELIAALRIDLDLRGILSKETVCHLNRAEKDFGHYRAARLTAEQVDAYISKRLADGDRPGTVNRTLVYLRQSYKLAIQREIINRAPFVRRKNEDDGIRREFFSETEIAAIVEALPDDLKDFTRWCAACGMRKGEASKLTWDMIHGDELLIPGNITKNGEDRTLPISGLPVLPEIIERRRQAATIEVKGVTRMVPFIFHRAGRAVSNFDKAWATATEAANCPGKIFHSLRRTAVRQMIRAHIPIPLAKLWSGHTTDDVFYRYGILDTNDMRNAFVEAEKFRENERATEEKKVISIRG
jgi:integrase